jgi:hypothetical protein
MSISVFARFFSTPVLVLSVLAGCGAGKSEGRADSSARVDTLSSSASVAGTASSSGKLVTPPRALYLDSGGFNPDGYYTAREAMKFDDRKIGWLELSTVEVDTTGRLSDDRPKLLQPPVGFLTVSEPNSINDAKFPCVVPVITPDSLSVKCLATPVGDVTINGHFLGKGGDYSDKFAETSTVLLVARVVISKGGEVIHNGLHRFTYYTGD